MDYILTQWKTQNNVVANFLQQDRTITGGTHVLCTADKQYRNNRAYMYSQGQKLGPLGEVENVPGHTQKNSKQAREHCLWCWLYSSSP